MNKAFTEATRIVAVKTTGNVFSFTAVDELNIKPKHFRDLISDVPFTRADVITLQDPMALRERTVDPVEASSVDPVEARRMFAEAKGEATPGGRALVARGAPAERTSAITAVANGEEARPSAARAGSLGGNGGMRSTGWAAASFTSTSMKIQTRNEAAEVPKSLITRKAYASLHTNLGILNLELHADVTPKAVENFLILARRGYFNATVCHRLIKNFMAQFGDPTGTGSGGESAWGGSFADEFSSKLSHNARGTVSMANSGPASNKSQFFLTFRPTPHLDHKHTGACSVDLFHFMLRTKTYPGSACSSVFGRVVGGLETTLAAIERVPTDKEDSPRQAISILSVTIHDDPFTAAAGDPRGSVVGADAVSIECGPVEHAPRPRAVAPPAKKAKLGYGTFDAF